MENYRLRVKIGASEFEAEGPENVVREQFEAFKQLITAHPEAAISAPVMTNHTAPNTTETPETPEAGIAPAQVKRLFVIHRGGKLLSLAFAPQGEDRTQAAFLLLLYGYKRLMDLEESPVTLLKEGLEQSGFNVNRIDRIAIPLIREALVLKGGKAKGGRYRLTNLGESRAEAKARTVLGQVK